MEDKNQRDESEIKIALEYSNNIIATLREPFLVLDKNLRIISANQAFYATFEVREIDTIGRLLPDLGNRQWNIPKLLELLKEILSEKKVIKDYEVEHKFAQIGERVMLVNACRIRVPKKITATIAAIAKEEELILLAIEDITERKRLQEELRASEERYRRAFETSRDGLLLVHKTEGGILNSNASVQGLLGYSPEELLKKKLWQLGMIKDDKDFQETVSRLEKDGVIHYADTLVKTQKGQSINAEVFLVNRAKVLQCNIRDITESKKIESVQAQLAAIIESSDDAIIGKDLNSIITSWNKGAERLYGYTEKEAIGKSISIIIPKEQADEPYMIMETIKNGQRMEHFETMRQKKDGKKFPVSATFSPVKDGDGRIIGASTIARDITERKKLSEEIKDSEAAYRALYDSSKDAVMIAVPEKGFIAGNAATIEMFRCRNEANFITKSPADLSPELQPDGVSSTVKAQEMMRIAMEKGSNFFEWTHKRLDGEEFFATVLLTRLELRGERVLQATVRDITEQKLTEAELKKRLDTLERFQKVTVDRELKMIELKKKIAGLEAKTGEKPGV